jgi:uncharacterized integral membrane protein
VPAEKKGIFMSSLKLITALVVATVVVLFGVQNTQAVSFHFLMFTLPRIAVVLPLFAAIVLGALLGWIVAAPGRFRGMRERHGLQDQVAAHERVEAMRIDASQPRETQPTVEAVSHLP